MLDKDIGKTVSDNRNTLFQTIKETENDIERNRIIEYYKSENLFNLNEKDIE